MIEHVHADQSHLIYLGKRSVETRFGVVGIHNVRRNAWCPFVMLELTYYPRPADEWGAMRVWKLPRSNRTGPFVALKVCRGHWWEVNIGWQRGRDRHG